MNTVTVSAAVSAIVTVLVGTMLNWGERVVSWLRRTVPPDHAPISGATVTGQAATANEKIRVVVACAPNRSLKRGDVPPQPAIEFVRKQFPGRFPDEPVSSMPPYWVRFEASSGVEDGYLTVYPTGRIDFCATIPTTPVDPGPVAFSVIDVLEPILAMLSAVRSPEYAHVFSARRRRLRRQRFDWAIAVSQTVNVPGKGGVAWGDVKFPASRPPRAGSSQMPSCPQLGYASPELRNWRVQASSQRLIRIFLHDFLQQNGFHEVDAAIEDTVTALAEHNAL